MKKKTKKEKAVKEPKKSRSARKVKKSETTPAPVEASESAAGTSTAAAEAAAQETGQTGPAVEPAESGTAGTGSPENDSPDVTLDTEATQSEVPLTLGTDDAIAVVTVNREAILNGLKVARDFIGRKNTMPILTNCLLTAARDDMGRAFLTLAATDLEVSWKTVYPCEATAEISRAVPLATLYSELKALTDDIKDAELAFTQNAVRVNGRCDIYTVAGDEYPSLPAVSGTGVNVSLTALRAVLPAVGQNDARYVLNGALLEFGKGRAVGTDGHRLHMHDIEKQDHRSIIIPRGAIELLSRHGGNDIALQVNDDNRFSCKLADGDMTGRLIDGNFPNYEMVIPESTPITVEFSARDMMKVFEGCLPIINDRTHAVALILNGKIEVQAVSSERGVYRWHVPGTVSGKDPEEIRIGFNVLYLQDAFRSYAPEGSETITLGLSDPLSPALINGKAVVMPMRV